MKKIYILVLLMIMTIVFSQNPKKNFLAGKHHDNFNINIRNLRSAEDKFYAGLSCFSYDKTRVWERGFYLVNESKYSQRDILDNVRKYFPDIMTDSEKTVNFFILALYTQMYEITRAMLSADYRELLYEGNWDQWWDTSEIIRHFFKDHQFHPNLIKLRKENGMVIAENTKLSFTFESGISKMSFADEELVHHIYSGHGYLQGKIAKEHSEFIPRKVEIKEDDINSGYKFDIYFGKIKAGDMIQYLQDSGEYYELFILLKTSPFFDKIFKMRDRIYVRLRKDDFTPIMLIESISQGQYRAYRTMELFPEEFYGIYNEKERVGLTQYVQDSYSAVYLLRSILPEKIQRIDFLSRKRVYPFKLKYENTMEKIGRNNVNGVKIIPEYFGALEIKDFNSEFFFSVEDHLCQYSKTYTPYGALTTSFSQRLTKQGCEEQGLIYEIPRD